MKVQTDLLTHTLPTELIISIFSLTIPPPHRDPWTELSPPHTTLTPLFLCKICRAWRSIVQGTPRLWTYVTLTLTRAHYDTQVSLLHGWLARSTHHPLSITVRAQGGEEEEEEEWEVRPPREVVQQLAAVCERWKEVDMFVPYACYRDLACVRGRLPILERLVIRPPDGVDSPLDSDGGKYNLDFFRDAPKLVDLHLTGLYYTNATSLPWAQLHDLHLQDLLETDCYSILARSSHLLEVARFNNIHQSSDFTYPSHTPITLPHLRTLELRTIGNTLAEVFLDSLVLPALVELRLGLGYTFEDRAYFRISHLTDLVLRSEGCGHTLRSLELSKIRVVEGELIECLAHVPQLVTLRVRAEYPPKGAQEGVNSISDTFLSALLPQSQPPRGLPGGVVILPNLEILEYTGPLTIQPHTLLTVLQHRCRSPVPTVSSTLHSESHSSAVPLASNLRKVHLESAHPVPLTPSLHSSFRSLILNNSGVEFTLRTANGGGFVSSIMIRSTYHGNDTDTDALNVNTLRGTSDDEFVLPGGITGTGLGLTNVNWGSAPRHAGYQDGVVVPSSSTSDVGMTTSSPTLSSVSSYPGPLGTFQSPLTSTVL